MSEERATCSLGVRRRDFKSPKRLSEYFFVDAVASCEEMKKHFDEFFCLSEDGKGLELLQRYDDGETRAVTAIKFCPFCGQRIEVVVKEVVGWGHPK